ncbi:MAG: hypothetical protein B7Z72_01640 [Gemmatimonadetes bacterium 21-71-4]|nr:MAG: hypothetical protein B7Z72_01640 [Gemmatimonadetes bacterium 21-71-4]
MRLPPTFVVHARTATLIAAVAAIGFLPPAAAAQANGTGHRGQSFAQALVEKAKVDHPDVDEAGILANTRNGCFGIASTDKTDVGGKCEADDIQPMKTGKPSVGKDGTGYDVSVLLHDARGNTVGVLSLGFKGGPGVTEASVLAPSTKIAAGMAPQIASKARLLDGRM